MLDTYEVRSRLRGVMVFAPTPFRPSDFELDLQGFRSNMEFLAQSGVHAVAVAGFVGEFSALTAAEYRSVVTAAAEALRDRALLICGVGYGTRMAQDYARVAVEGGADCIMLLPPYLVEPSEPGMIAHTRAIAAASAPVGLMIHSIPGTSYSPALLRQLSDIDGVIAYKDELGDIRGFQEVVATVGDRLIYVVGRAEPVLVPYFAAGATVIASAIANFDPALALRTYEAAQRRDYVSAAALLAPKATPWYRLRERNRRFLISVTKETMNAVGMAGGVARPPLSPLAPHEHDELIELLRAVHYIPASRTTRPEARTESLPANVGH